MAAPDPFEAARADVQRALRDTQRLQRAAFSGDGASARRLPAALAALSEELSDLGAAVDAMARAPARFGLTRDAVALRRGQVDGLRAEASELQRVCAGAGIFSGGSGSCGGGGGLHGGRVSSGGLEEVELGKSPRDGRPAGPKDAAKAGSYYHRQLERSKAPAAAPTAARGSGSGGGGGDVRLTPDAGGGWGAGGHEWYAQEQLQAHVMARQDDMLGDIEMQVGRIKQTGLAMGEELEQHSLLLGALQGDADATYLRLRGAQKRVAQFVRAAKSDRQLQLICFLSVVLAILVFTSLL